MQLAREWLVWEEAEMPCLDKHRIRSPENYRLPLNFMHFKHAMWLCGVPKEQTAQLALKESQLCVRMTFFHNKTAATTKSNSRIFVANWEIKVPAGFKQNLLAPSPNRPKVCFRSRLSLGPLCSVGGGGGVMSVMRRGDCGALKGGGDRRNSGSVQRTWIPKVTMNVCLPGDSL